VRFLWLRQRHHLIGPTFFPIYLLVLKVALAIALVVTAGFAVLGPTGDAEFRPGPVEVLTFFIRRSLIVFAWTTLVFAALDLWQARFLRHTSWDPRRLPAVVRFEDRMSRLDSLIQLVIVSAGLVWLLLVPFFPFLLLGGAARVLELTSIWAVVYAPMVVLTAAVVVFHAVNLSRPYWTPARSAARILIRLGTLLLYLMLLTTDTWVAAKVGSTLPNVASLESVVEVINLSCRITLIVASIGTFSGIVREIFLVRSRRKTSQPAMKVRRSEAQDLLERYLQAIRLFVPRRQHADIVAEVSTDLATRMEDLQKEIGRPLTDDERVDVLRRNGNPVVVAGQYRGHERLIGPPLFPVYLNTLVAGLAITFLVTLLLGQFLPAGTDGRRPAFLDILAKVPLHGLMMFAGTTLVFASAERWQSRRRSDALASRERADAQAIQRALLPAVLPGFIGCELAVRWQPASAFGGDCYDAIRLSDTTLALSIADVCGKGLPAALVMSSLQASVRAFALVDSTPRSVVSQLNQALCRNVDLRRFVTFFYGVYDSNTRRLTYSNAGHNPPAVVRADGSVLRLAGGGMVVGMVDAATYKEEEVTLAPGDRLVLFTDGITEAESSEGLEFGDDRLLETVVRSRSSNPDRILRCLFDEVTRFAGRHLRDDATAIAVAIR
jgi:serine phosphatase RsbU (regulator of sigma subunit)